ncbi:MAG: ABC transporter permease [Lachnospiraceae bacterium]|nr:ABC transporter permease [Lachnospiraceae bacterium]
MKNPMNKRLFRELKADLGKYLVIFLFIAMVVSVVSSFLVANSGVKKAYTKLLENNKVEDGHLNFNLVPGDDVISVLEEKGGLKLYRADFFEESLNDKGTLRVYYLNEDVNIPEVTSGRLPENDSEIALDNLHSLHMDIKVGDTVTVGKKSLTVSGLVALPNYSSLFKDNADIMFDSENFGVALMTKEGFENFASDHETISYAWLYNEKKTSDKEKSDAAENVISALKEALIQANSSVYLKILSGEKDLTILEVKDLLPAYENQSINFAGEDMDGDSAAILMFLYIVVVVLAFIISVTTINTLSKEATVIGTLRASGYTRAEMIRHYMILPIAAFTVGMIVGNVLGYTVMKQFMLNIYFKMYSLGKIETLWNPYAFWITTLIPMVIMIVINFAILAHKMHIGPLNFLRRDISGKTKKRALRLNRKIPFTSRFRIRIILQNMPNYITMIVGVILAGAIIIFGLMFEPLLNEVADRIENTAISRYQYLLKTPEEAESEQAEKFALTSFETTQKDFKVDGISVYGIVKDSSYIKAEIPEGKVLLSNGFMEKYGYKAGDTVSLYDKFTDKIYEFTVAGDYPYEAALSVFMNIDEFNTEFDKTPDYYSGYFSNEELDKIETSNIYMTLDNDEFSGFADQLWASFADFMGPVKWFGVIMFVLMVYLLSKQIIERNAVSISMTKILGFTGGEIGGLYILATSVIVVIGLLLAVPVVDQLMRLVFKHYLYKRMSGYLPYAISSDCYVKMVLIGLVSYILVAVFQMIKINRIPKTNALKTLE